ncbi:MAG: acetylxylan esterase, partial [Planctomycetes bacterium]|nr:acetylxylan esterase [Planctomycetota bacterium]
PDPLVLASGEKVTDAKTWRTKRRPEILKLFQTYVYGTMPGKPKEMPVDVNGHDNYFEWTLHFSKDRSGPQADLLVVLPSVYGFKPPYPTFLAYNFNGNHTIDPDELIKKSLVWPRRGGGKPSVPGDETRGRSASRWPVEKILKRGYALATIYYGDVDPDFHDMFRNGVHALHPELQERGDNWTSIGAWAWGLSRAMDFFETKRGNHFVDPKRVVVLGHSRLGKTALWAGASDERFAMVISNNSGCGGAALSRREFGETVKRINTSFPHWFCANFKKFNDNVSSLPVDQHMLVSLIAPRPVYIASAQQDRWADPRGEFLSGLHADPVYRLLGVDGIGTNKMPEVDKPVNTGTIGYHVRTGKHNVTDFDWTQYLDFADRHFNKKP